MVHLLPHLLPHLLLLLQLQVNSDVLLGGLRYRNIFFIYFACLLPMLDQNICCPWQNIFTIGTCEEIQLTLTGGAFSAQGGIQGLYVKSGTSNGEPVWSLCTSSNSLWLADNGIWIIGPNSLIGIAQGFFYNPVSGPPYGNGDDWLYWDGFAWIKPVGEIEVECTSK